MTRSTLLAMAILLLAFQGTARAVPVQLSSPGTNVLNLYSNTATFDPISVGPLVPGWNFYRSPSGNFVQIYTRSNGFQPAFDFLAYLSAVPAQIDFQAIDYNWTTNTIDGGFRYDLVGPNFASFGAYGSAGGPVGLVAPLAATPEPSTVAVIGVGIAFAALGRRRRSRLVENAS